MSILISVIIGYFLYSAFLVVRDFGLSHPDSGQLHNAPTYVFQPNFRTIAIALLNRPLLQNRLDLFLYSGMGSQKIWAIVKLFIKVGLIAIILRSVFQFFA
ncbi:hypothetical protein A3D60_01455 [Candidatus Uhrbacteria bacterium RIFCSPHIGHO2_02_FULL_47_29]|nr:MAG: hypothetical protein A3D60_01455 [Candidatus Uhrbacteria bacterium RIFCSPHIGHO2_02_FULL_47_29]